jgi:hypothetical protein
VILIAAVLLSNVDLALVDGLGKPALAFRRRSIASFDEIKERIGSSGDARLR